jgi:hypothetical protein
MGSRSRRAIRASFAWNVPFRIQRAQGMPGARCARSRACSVVNTRVSHHGHTGFTRHSPRNGFNGLYRALPGDRACLPPSFRGKSREACRQRRGVRTTRLRRPRLAPFVKGASASTASRPTSVTIAKRPFEGRDGANHTGDSISEKQKYFCKGDWTRHNSKASGRQSDLPVGQIGLQGFIMMRLSAEQSPSLRRSDRCAEEFPQQRQIAARLVRTRAWRPFRNRRWQGAATAATSRHCRIASRIVRLAQHRCWPAKAAARGGACSSMVRAGRS